MQPAEEGENTTAWTTTLMPAKAKRKKMRCGIKMIRHLPTSSDHSPGFRFFGDFCFMADPQLSKNLGFGLWNYGKQIAGLDTDHKSRRINVFYHPTSGFDTPDRSTWNVINERIADHKLDPILRALDKLEQIYGILPTYVGSLPRTDDPREWSQLFRAGIPPFEPLTSELNEHALTCLWEVIPKESGQYDMIIRAVSLSYRLLTLFGYSWEEGVSMIQKNGVPDFAGTDPNQLYFKYSTLLQALAYLVSHDAVGLSVNHACGPIYHRDGTKIPVARSGALSLFMFNGRLFYKSSGQLRPRSEVNDDESKTQEAIQNYALTGEFPEELKKAVSIRTKTIMPAPSLEDKPLRKQLRFEESTEDSVSGPEEELSRK